MEQEYMKIGDLAKMVGVTVRTLHHYHQIGLLIPGHVTEGGHRLYDEEDLKKLYHILALKDFGFSLEEIRDLMHSVSANPLYLIDFQLKKATEMLQWQQKLCDSLKEVQRMLRAHQSPSVSDLVEIVVMMQMNTRFYLTDEQIAQIKEVYRSIPAEEERDIKEGWRSFISRLEKCRSHNLPVDDPEVKALASYWQRFVKTVTGNDPDIMDAVFTFHADRAGNKQNVLQYGLTPELFQYLQRAMQSSNANESGEGMAAEIRGILDDADNERQSTNE